MWLAIRLAIRLRLCARSKVSLTTTRTDNGRQGVGYAVLAINGFGRIGCATLKS